MSYPFYPRGQTYEPFDNARYEEHHLWLFCKRCGLHASTHYTCDGVEMACSSFNPNNVFRRKTQDPNLRSFEWCENCDKHVRHHYGTGERPPRCQPLPDCQQPIVESKAMTTSSFGGEGNPVFATVGTVTSRGPTIEKGVRNYPLGTAATQIGGSVFGVGQIGPTEMYVEPPAWAYSDPIPPKKSVDDPINPKHYKGDLVMRIIEHFELDKSFALGNCVKYLLRAFNKNGTEDLRKAAWYLQREIDRRDGKHQFASEAGPKLDAICELCGAWNGAHVQGCPGAVSGV